MTDIVDRLESFSKAYDRTPGADITVGAMRDAIAVIEDNRREISLLESEIKSLSDKVDNREQVFTALLDDQTAEVDRLRTRIQDEIERNEARAQRMYDAMPETKDSTNYARVIAKAVCYSNAAAELSHILTQG